MPPADSGASTSAARGPHRPSAQVAVVTSRIVTEPSPGASRSSSATSAGVPRPTTNRASPRRATTASVRTVPVGPEQQACTRRTRPGGRARRSTDRVSHSSAPAPSTSTRRRGVRSNRAAAAPRRHVLGDRDRRPPAGVPVVTGRDLEPSRSARPAFDSYQAGRSHPWPSTKTAPELALPLDPRAHAHRARPVHGFERMVHVVDLVVIRDAARHEVGGRPLERLEPMHVGLVHIDLGLPVDDPLGQRPRDPTECVIHTDSATQKPRASSDSPISGKPSGVNENTPSNASPTPAGPMRGISSTAVFHEPSKSSGVNGRVAWRARPRASRRVDRQRAMLERADADRIVVLAEVEVAVEMAQDRRAASTSDDRSPRRTACGRTDARAAASADACPPSRRCEGPRCPAAHTTTSAGKRSPSAVRTPVTGLPVDVDAEDLASPRNRAPRSVAGAVRASVVRVARARPSPGMWNPPTMRSGSSNGCSAMHVCDVDDAGLDPPALGPPALALQILEPLGRRRDLERPDHVEARSVGMLDRRSSARRSRSRTSHHATHARARDEARAHGRSILRSRRAALGRAR